MHEFGDTTGHHNTIKYIKRNTGVHTHHPARDPQLVQGKGVHQTCEVAAQEKTGGI